MADGYEAEHGDTNAFNLLLSDIIERLLALSDNPAKASSYIAEELRGLIGARTVAVVSHVEHSGFEHHLVRSVYPARRKDLVESDEFMKLVELTRGYRNAQIFDDRDTAVASELLRKLSIFSALILPLYFGNHRVGAIVLLDFLDAGSLHKVLDLLERLSSVFALILRNADLYANLEERVADRTLLLERRSQELEALLKEVHHRVKNNLQIVLSLLHLTSSTTTNEEARALLETSQARIFAMSLVHDEIYRTGDFSGIDMAAYIPRIADQLLVATYPAVERAYSVESLRLSLDQAIPCGLIVSELVTNAIKHAFAQRGKGKLIIETGMRNGEAFIRIADDGPGFKTGTEGCSRSGIGLDIIESLLGQIGGRMAQESVSGTSCSLIFKVL